MILQNEGMNLMGPRMPERFPVANTSPSRPNDADSANTDNRRMGNGACGRRNRDYSASPKPRRRWNGG